MSGPLENTWSGSPNAPRITYEVYLLEKENFAGILLGGVFYGVVIILFFQCMGTLLDPVIRTRGGIKWGLLAYTVAVFSFVTIFTVTALNVQLVSYVEFREVPDGPLFYHPTATEEWLAVMPEVVFSLNQWLADGLLLYRCYVIYAMNYWVIAFPCLVYLVNVAMGIVFIYETSGPAFYPAAALNMGVSFFSISFSLNVILTLMIATRLMLHSRNIQNAIGAPTKTSGLYKAIVTMLVESSAIYAVAFIPYIVPRSIESSVSYVFFPTLLCAQVIGPFLIILRVASQRALASETIVSEHIGSVRFQSQESTVGSAGLPDGRPMTSTNNGGEILGWPGIAAETTIDSHCEEIWRASPKT